MNRFMEFFEDSNRRLSSTRLSALLGVFVGSVINIWLTYQGKLGGDIFGIYMACTGGMYSFGKWRESVTDMEQIRADSPYPQQPPPQPIPEAAPATVINVAGGGAASATEKVQDATIVAEGDVNVTPKSDNGSVTVTPKPKKKK